MPDGLRLALDLDAVGGWLSRSLRRPVRFVKASQFNAGQSNPTYLLLASTGERIVLRRQPPGALLPSAHDVSREWRCLAALESTRVPVPRPLAFCADSNVLGVQWYAMAFVPGTVYDDVALPSLSPKARNSTWTHAAEVLADLHALDVAAVGLQRHGASGGYALRQLRVWGRQFGMADAFVREASATTQGGAHGHGATAADVATASADMTRLEKTLRRHAESRRAASGWEAPCVVHGDYRLGNLVVREHATTPRVVAVR